MDESSVMEKIKVIVLVPQKVTKTLLISRNLQIGKISMVFPNVFEFTYSYNGIVLNPNLTFKDLNIANGGVIVAFKKRFDQFDDNDFKIMKLTTDIMFQEKIRIFTNKKSKNEYFRLKDIRSFKMEGRKKSYIKMYRRFNSQNLQKSENNSLDIDLDINYEPLSTPSTEAMPILW